MNCQVYEIRVDLSDSTICGYRFMVSINKVFTLTLYDTKQNSFTYHKNDHKNVRLFIKFRRCA